MSAQKYSVNQYLTEPLLTWAKSGEVAISESQRPFETLLHLLVNNFHIYHR